MSDTGSDRPSTGSLADDARSFSEMLMSKYASRIRRAPKDFKARVISLFRFNLPPYPRPGGRRPSRQISQATEMYQLQRREVRQGKRADADWRKIAQDTIPGFASLAEYRRHRAIERLRNAVHARRRRMTQRRRKALRDRKKPGDADTAPSSAPSRDGSGEQ